MLLFSSFIFSVAVLAFWTFFFILRMGEFYYYICRLFFYSYLSFLVPHSSLDLKQARWRAPGSPHAKAPEKAGPVRHVPSTFRAPRPQRTGHRVYARNTVP